MTAFSNEMVSTRIKYFTYRWTAHERERERQPRFLDWAVLLSGTMFLLNTNLRIYVRRKS
jgi:hypothetical protein